MLYVATDRRVVVVDSAASVVRESFAPGEFPGIESGVRVECVAASPSRSDRAFVGTFGAGLFRSTDGGGSFERVALGSGENDVHASNVTAMAVAPWDPDVVFAGTEPSRVYRSTDGGVSFEHVPGLVELPSSGEWAFPPRPETHHVRWLEPVRGVEGRVLVAVEAGALVVLDVDVENGSGSFRERPPGARRDTHSMATHPAVPERVFAAAGDGYAESADGGESWTHPQDGLEHRYCWSVAVDSGDPGVRLVSAASGAYSAHSPGRAETYVYRKRGDEPWELAMEGFGDADGRTRPVLASGDDPGVFFALSNRGLFRTTDAGGSWSRVELDADVPFGERGGTARGLVYV